MLELLLSKLYHLNSLLEASITILRLCRFEIRFWSVGLSCLRFLLLSNLWHIRQRITFEHLRKKLMGGYFSAALMLKRECWWSLWMLFVLFEFAWKREVLAIINSTKVGMMFYLSFLPKSICIVLRPFRTFLLVRIDFFYSKNIILGSRDHSKDSKNTTLDSRTCSLDHRAKTNLIRCGMTVKAWPLVIKSQTVYLVYLFYLFTSILAFELFDYTIFGAVL